MKKKTAPKKTETPIFTRGHSGNRWTDAELTILHDELRSGKSHREIAFVLTKRFGRLVTRGAVQHHSVRLNDHEQLSPLPAKKLGRSQEAAAERELALVQQLVRASKKPTTLEALCNLLDVSPARLKSLADTAKANGYRVEITGDTIGRAPSTEVNKTFDIIVKKALKKRVIALVGDVHIGSKHHLHPQFVEFCGQAYERGVRHFCQPGDLTDGVYKHSRYEQSAHGFEEQTELLASKTQGLPWWKDATWHVISGNHDETHGDESGLDAGRAYVDRFASLGRKDLIYYGPRRAYLRIAAKDERRGVFVEMWHPRGSGSAYAKSYKPQRHVAAYAPGQKPDICAIGHWHSSMYLTDRGVHIFSVGCWQGSGSSFGKSLGYPPDIGSWIVEYALTEDGAVREISPTWVSFYETEVVRDVSLG